MIFLVHEVILHVLTPFNLFFLKTTKGGKFIGPLLLCVCQAEAASCVCGAKTTQQRLSLPWCLRSKGGH